MDTRGAAEVWPGPAMIPSMMSSCRMRRMISPSCWGLQQDTCCSWLVVLIITAVVVVVVAVVVVVVVVVVSSSVVPPVYS